MNEIVVALIAAVPSTFTAGLTIWANSQRRKDKQQAIQRAERNTSKNAIISLVNQDILRYEILGRLPANQTDIDHEYRNYHDNGGNDNMTRFVEDYRNWLKEVENGREPHVKRLD